MAASPSGGRGRSPGGPGRPRIVTGRYVSLGPAAERTADEYIHHYYGPDYCAAARADTFTDVVELRAAVDELAEAGCDDLVLFPCSGDVDEVARVAEAVVEVSA